MSEQEPEEKTSPAPVEKPSEEKKEQIKQAAEEKFSWREVLSSNKTWIAVILFILLFILTGLVPVSKIPVLRSLAYAMGYSEEETEQMSFLRALLTWKDHAKNVTPSRDEILRGGDLTRVADKDRIEQNKLNASLLNFRASNRNLRKQGKEIDQVKEVSKQNPTQEDKNAVSVKGNGENVLRQSTIPSEVYFGGETEGVKRDKNDGFDSTKILSKLKNPYQVNSDRHDWLYNQADKAFWANSGIDGLMNGLNAKNAGGVRLNSNLGDTSDKKSHRDMYYAWLTSRAGVRTDDYWLKKTLASAGFMGADLDRQKLVFSGSGGIALDEDAIMADMENIELRKKMEEKCNESLSSTGEGLKTILEKASNDIQGLAGQFPKNCDELDDGFLNAVSGLENQCKQAEKSYKEIKESCQTNYVSGGCELPDLKARYSQYSEYCEKEAEKCGENPEATEEEIKACLNNRKKSEDCKGDDEEDNCGCTGTLLDGNGCNAEALNTLVKNTTGELSGFLPGQQVDLTGQSWTVDVNNFKE